MTEFKIVSDVGMPDEGNVKYPFAQMDVGQFFHVPAPDGANAAQLNALRKRVAGSASMASKRLGVKFSTRIVMWDGKPGVGVWRVT